MYALCLGLIVVSVEALALSLPSFPSSVDETLERWEAIRDGGNVKEVSTCASALREMSEKGDSVVRERLLAITENRSQSSFSRTQALTVACELADAEGARAIVEMMATLLTQIRIPPEEIEKFREALELLEFFFCRPARQLLHELPDHQGVLSLASAAYFTTALWSEGTRDDIAKAIVECRVPA